MISMSTKQLVPVSQRSVVRRLTESALLVALAAVLAIYAVFKLPNGGSVTIGSAIPIMLVSFKYSFGWSLLVALAYSLIQMLTGFYAPPVATAGYYVLMILLDYVVAFGVFGLAGSIYRALDKKLAPRLRLMAAALACIALRFVCHFLSGLIIWQSYAPEGQPLWLYSLLYNGSYMLGEGLISGLILYLIGQKLVSLFLGKEGQA
jgi:thiamine transporter